MCLKPLNLSVHMRRGFYINVGATTAGSEYLLHLGTPAPSQGQQGPVQKQLTNMAVQWEEPANCSQQHVRTFSLQIPPEQMQHFNKQILGPVEGWNIFHVGTFGQK